MKLKLIFLGICLISLIYACQESDESGIRQKIVLNSNWKTIEEPTGDTVNDSKYIRENFKDSLWQTVNVPHNWDQYYGYRRMKHGNLHGTAWYRKKMKIGEQEEGKQYFLYFEGVGSYATVWVNGEKVGGHKGGRTTFTLNITDALKFSAENTIVVKAAHPAFIADLPWVCGGCSGEWGFSEGSQPLGIFRPVSLIVTNDVKVQPFGVHIWNGNDISEKKARVFTETELKNFGDAKREIKVAHKLTDTLGKIIVEKEQSISVAPNEVKKIKVQLPEIENPKLWSPENPYLYTLVTTITENGETLDEVKTPYGIRSISWPIGREGEDNRFFLNGKPYLINGTCEYEHLMGKSHSFGTTEIKARVEQIEAGGFNAFREAHQPHNLRYQNFWDKDGILFWSQFSAHIWYDTPAFKENFKNLLREWIKERRNSPSIILWGLQNESTIPKEFAEECTAIIREMDPTASEQRKVVTCNGGKGTDWNVIQNWSGTYGGDPLNYDNELKKDLLNGEYGAWRTADVHTEGTFKQKGKYSENRFSQLMEIKVREAEAVRDSVVGQFNWLYSSHENPGRIQNGEAFRDIDRIGPVNYKGLFTIWGEPLDTYYMYRANYVSPKTNPMVYIVSHSWPERWSKLVEKDTVTVYSNCDEVELFNDVDSLSLGKLKNPGRGEHFQWNAVPIHYNVLYAVGYVDGKQVAKDKIMLDNLPKSPHFEALTPTENLLEPETGINYLYRVNAGGPSFTDSFGNAWSADVHQSGKDTWGSLSWTDDFEDLPDFYASQRRTFDPIAGTKNQQLFQTFRFGMDKLRYEFPVENGEYQVELYFTEPWYGTGGGMDCTGWRNFDIAINGKIVQENLDIWKEVGHDKALKKTYTVNVENNHIEVSFPHIASGEALISGIAITSADLNEKPAAASPRNITDLQLVGTFKNSVKIASWLDKGQKQYTNSSEVFTRLPYQIYGADWLRFPKEIAQGEILEGSFLPLKDSDVYVLFDKNSKAVPTWLSGYQKTDEEATNSEGHVFQVYHKNVKKNDSIIIKQNDPSSMMYSIAVVPEYEMGEGEEKRPVFTYKTEDAVIEGDGVTSGNFKESDYVAFPQHTQNKIEWQVNPGLAGVHLMRFRYMNMTAKPIKVRLQIESANGVMMRDEYIEFPPASVKWKILNTTTGAYINAGIYRISLSGENFRGLRLNNFEFQ